MIELTNDPVDDRGKGIDDWMIRMTGGLTGVFFGGKNDADSIKKVTLRS